MEAVLKCWVKWQRQFWKIRMLFTVRCVWTHEGIQSLFHVDTITVWAALVASGIRKMRRVSTAAPGAERDSAQGLLWRKTQCWLEDWNEDYQSCIQPHYNVPALKKHKPVKAAWQLNERIWAKNAVFCCTDQCMLCTMDEHKGHEAISAAAERASTLYGVATDMKSSICVHLPAMYCLTHS